MGPRAGQLVLTAWSGQTEQPRALRSDNQEERRGRPPDPRAGTSDTVEVSMNG